MLRSSLGARASQSFQYFIHVIKCRMQRSIGTRNPETTVGTTVIIALSMLLLTEVGLMCLCLTGQACLQLCVMFAGNGAFSVLSFPFPFLRKCAFGTGSLFPQAGQREQGSVGL